MDTSSTQIRVRQGRSRGKSLRSHPPGPSLLSPINARRCCRYRPAATSVRIFKLFFSNRVWAVVSCDKTAERTDAAGRETNSTPAHNARSGWTLTHLSKTSLSRQLLAFCHCVFGACPSKTGSTRRRMANACTRTVIAMQHGSCAYHR
jgi:hypothetical protein